MNYLAHFWWVPPVVIFLVIWTVPWKGYALWKAARNNEPIWFVVLLLVNTLAVLEIFYIFIFAKDKRSR